MRVPIRPRGAAGWAVAVLLLIDIVLNAAVLVSASNEVDRVRGDFCSWARVHAQAAASSPPSPAHSADAASDRLLVQRLGC